jgi:hypothetical protein
VSDWFAVIVVRYNCADFSGHVMIVKSIGRYGDRVSLRSPIRHSADCPKSSSLSFRYYMQRDDDQNIGGLEVIALSEHRVPIRTMFSWKEIKFARYNEWVSTELELPEVDFFYVMFVAVIGKPFASDVLIDDVTVNCISRQETEPGRQLLPLGTV